ncbi:VAN3-binding protein-like, auxin canalization domain [Dillenia turbinata]|uniref:VAN3-binding protein-like, auxin canalization domain n=1 Tax=Dillenia turbinata TaxID=194707 RepID=A0AAN8VME1_9MAGN
MDMKYVKGWLKGKSLTSFFKWHQGKKKEEVRFNTAKVHAALSVAQLAAALAGLAAKGSLGGTQDNQKITHRDQVAEKQNMGVVLASAAALVATVCAEAAESAGAHRTHVASAINSGLAAQTSTDMVALTATAATSLRGAATLKSRILENSNNRKTQYQDLLKVGAQLLVSTPSGKKGYKSVSIFVKHNQIVLSCGKKYLGGVLNTSKEYKITNVKEITRDAQGHYLVTLKTNSGNINLLFEDPKQSTVCLDYVLQMTPGQIFQLDKLQETQLHQGLLCESGRKNEIGRKQIAITLTHERSTKAKLFI